MNRLEVGTRQAVNRIHCAAAQNIYREIKGGSFYTVVRGCTGKWMILITGKSTEIPQDWYNYPNLILTHWHDWIKATNNRDLIENFTFDGYED